MDREILSIMDEIHSRSAGAVYAWQVAMHMSKYPRSERTVRSRMAALAEAGELERMGMRKGYRRASARFFIAVIVMVRGL